MFSPCAAHEVNWSHSQVHKVAEGADAAWSWALMRAPDLRVGGEQL